MVNKYSVQLLWRVVALWRVALRAAPLLLTAASRYFCGWTKQRVADTLVMHRNTVRKVAKRFLAGEELDGGKKKTRRRGTLSLADLGQLRLLVWQVETLHLEELANDLSILLGRRVTVNVVLHGLRELRLTRKKACAVARLALSSPVLTRP